jgi:hypothetical protein
LKVKNQKLIYPNPKWKNGGVGRETKTTDADGAKKSFSRNFNPSVEEKAKNKKGDVVPTFFGLLT